MCHLDVPRCHGWRRCCVSVRMLSAAVTIAVVPVKDSLNDVVALTRLGQRWFVQHPQADVVICHGPNLVAVSPACNNTSEYRPFVSAMSCEISCLQTGEMVRITPEQRSGGIKCLLLSTALNQPPQRVPYVSLHASPHASYPSRANKGHLCIPLDTINS
jgi:hypothetical protein